MGQSHPIPCVPWDGKFLKNVPWDGMGRKFFKIVPSHGTKYFLYITSHPMGQTFSYKNFLFIKDKTIKLRNSTWSNKAFDSVSRTDKCGRNLFLFKYILTSVKFHRIGWDGTQHFWKSSHPMGRKFFKSSPIPWDTSENFIPWDDFFRPIPSHAEPW